MKSTFYITLSQTCTRNTYNNLASENQTNLISLKAVKEGHHHHHHSLFLEFLLLSCTGPAPQTNSLRWSMQVRKQCCHQKQLHDKCGYLSAAQTKGLTDHHAMSGVINTTQLLRSRGKALPGMESKMSARHSIALAAKNVSSPAIRSAIETACLVLSSASLSLPWQRVVQDFNS